MIRHGRSQRTEAEDIIYPVKGFRGEMEKRGIKPKDHHKDNLNDLKKKKEEFIKKQKDLEESKKESNWKLKKFQKVESLALKDKKEIEELKKQKLHKKAESAVSKIPDNEDKKSVSEHNYIKENALKALSPPKKIEEKTQDNVYSLNPHFGKVPK